MNLLVGCRSDTPLCGLPKTRELASSSWPRQGEFIVSDSCKLLPATSEAIWTEALLKIHAKTIGHSYALNRVLKLVIIRIYFTNSCYEKH